MLHRLVALILGAIVCTSVGCRSGTKEVKLFCSIDRKERLELYRSYPIEKRYELFVNADNEATCEDDSLAAGSYLIDDLVTNEADIDFLYRKLQETTDETIQQDIIWGLYRNRNLLMGRSDIAKVAIEKSAAMKGTLFNRIIGSNIAVEGTRRWAAEIESTANANKHDRS